MGLRRFQFIPDRSNVEVVATSRIHDVKMRALGVTGSLEGLEEDARGTACIRVEVPMSEFSTGDRLKDWKLASTLDTRRFPTASFTLDGLDRVETQPDGTQEIAGRGILLYRGHEVEIVFEGKAQLESAEAWAKVGFSLDLTAFGIQPPSLLGLKVSPVVSVSVTVRAVSAED